jgi:glycerol-3-phosphate acyltransferase PlsY
MDPLTAILFLLGSYLVGSLSPSYFLARILHDMDIREQGTRNAGTVNAFKVLGLGPGLLTALFDLSKGLLVMYLASLVGGSHFFIHLAGVTAILGHVYPFYIHFKGGQGIATATAILIYYLILFYTREWLPWESLALLALSTLIFAYITKIGEVVGTVILPVLAIIVLTLSDPQDYQLYLISIIAYIVFINILNIKQFHLLPHSPTFRKNEITWRLFIRPFATLFLITYVKADKRAVLILVGGVLFCFLFLDIVRLSSRRINLFLFQFVRQLYKPKERMQPSSITYFLAAVFFTILFSDRGIAILAISFLIFGDLFSKFFGLHFGRHQLFGKSLEGTLAHLNACLLAGYIFLHFMQIPAYVLISGALIASVVELLPLALDDNLSVPLLSALGMYIFQAL